MTFGVLYIDEGNFLNWYERREDAEAAVLSVVQQDPEVADDLGYFAYGEDGAPLSAFISGRALLGTASSSWFGTRATTYSVETNGAAGVAVRVKARRAMQRVASYIIDVADILLGNEAAEAIEPEAKSRKRHRKPRTKA